MAEEKIEMPCPACPEGCPHLSATCRPICKIWKEWQAGQATPRPKVTEADAYRNAQHKKACERLVKRGRRW